MIAALIVTKVVRVIILILNYAISNKLLILKKSGWTAVTADGKRSAQFEHTMIVTDDGVEVLTARVPGQSPPFRWDEVDFKAMD